jgi:hypothetical protein
MSHTVINLIFESTVSERQKMSLLKFIMKHKGFH